MGIENYLLRSEKQIKHFDESIKRHHSCWTSTKIWYCFSMLWQ